MISIKLNPRVGRPDKLGRHSLGIQLSQSGRRCTLTTGIKLNPEDFDQDTGYILYAASSAYTLSEVAILNHKLQNLLTQINSRIAESPHASVQDIASWYARRNDRRNVFTFLEMMIAEKQRLHKHGIAQAYTSTLKSLKRYCNGERLRFGQIDTALLNCYSAHLQQRGDSLNTVAYYIRNLRTAYNRAADESVFLPPQAGSPFRKIKSSPRQTEKRALTTRQVRYIATAELYGNPQAELARDMFMASFYLRGMPFVDLISLTKENIRDNTVHYRRHKTGSLLSIGIITPLRHIIEKYADGSNYLFPLSVENGKRNRLSYSDYRNALLLYNRNLKLVGRNAGIETAITGYMARHSWATCAKHKGASTAVISEGLGHSSERITQVYLKNFDNVVLDEVNEKVAEL